MRPRADPARALWALTSALATVESLEAATTWPTRLHDWHAVHGNLVREHTYRAQTPLVPGWVHPDHAWWYTHHRLRRAYQLLERLARENVLFTHLDPTLPDLDATTNKIEGAVNSPLLDMAAPPPRHAH